MNAASTDVFNVDPLLSARLDATAIADLAFGSITVGNSQLGNRHLALLTAETLELDLSDPAQRQFGDYELLEMIGEGGMGVVYRARQASLDREVAVKLLAAGPWASKEFIERFRREAQNAARMQHPNIVAIYEVGSAEELHFFSMRLICGGSLAAVLKHEGKLTAPRAAQLLRTIAEAVDYAHRLGVLHLDLKPANVLLDDNGNPHVADFGLARRMEQGLATDNDEVSGTPSYMAPEQATAGAQKITPATDIWGLGAILYELVTGQPPFLGDSAQATLKLVVGSILRSPRAIVADLPRDLEAIIRKCMERDVSARYRTARALADDLGRFIEKRPVLARRLNGAQRVWRWAKRQPYLAALGLLFTISMLAGIVGVSAQWRRAEGNAARAAASAEEAKANEAISSQRLWEGRREAALRQQEDGKGFEALPALIANIEEQEKAGKADMSMIERREIGMILSQGVTLIDRMIVPDAPPLAAELSPDGRILALGLGDVTVRWYDSKSMAELGRVDLRALPTSSGEELAPKWLRFIDGRHLLVSMDWPDYFPSPNGRDTYLIDLEHARAVEPPAEFDGFTDAVYSSDGGYALLFNRSNELQAWRVDPWRPLSRKISMPSGADSWWVGRNGRFAAYTAGSPATHLKFYDLHDMSTPKHDLTLPGTSVSAWAEDDHGSTFAVGDNAGYVYLVDPQKSALRQLPTPAGSQVNWISFSDDGAWLAAVRRDGAIFAFDAASGRPLNSGQMREDIDLRQVAISHRDRLLVASGFGESALWRFPLPGPQGQEAHRLISRPTASTRAGTHAAGAALAHNLLLTANRDGEVRLWRIPPPQGLPMKASTAATSRSDNFYFDGEHVVDVEYSHLRVVSTRDGTATEWTQLPQPVGYAELVDRGRTLIATAGPMLFVFDATSMQPRLPAIALPANPQGLAAGPDADFAVFAFGHNSNSGFEEELVSYDLKTGRRRGEATVPGPVRKLQLSDDGRRLVSVGPPRGATEVFDPLTLGRLGAYPHDPDHPVLWADFLPESSQLWLLLRNTEDSDVPDGDLLRWEPATNTAIEKRRVAGVMPVGVFAATGKPVLATNDRLLLDVGSPDMRESARMHGSEVSTVFAHSHDRRLIAHAYSREVRVYDASTLAPIGPPLQTGTHAIDGILRLAFSPDDGYILAQTGTGVLALWRVGQDNRALAAIRNDAELLSTEPSSAHVLQMPVVAQRANLRQRDSGERHAAETRPRPIAARSIDGVPIPARDPRASPLLLDLTDAYNLAPGRLETFDSTVIPSGVSIPWGITRIDGVDYDIRGAIEMRTYGHGGVKIQTGAARLPSRIQGIRTPSEPIAAFHLLIYAPLDVPVVDERTYCSIRLHYHDGSTAVLPIRIQREVGGGSDRDQIVPIAWSQSDHLRLIGIMKQMLIGNPRLPNPYPEKLVVSLDLETGDQTWNEPIFYAITLEPVIATGNFRTQEEQDNGSKSD
jgi:WD40 repeat protein